MEEQEPRNHRKDYFREYYQKKKEEITAQKQTYRRNVKLEVIQLLGSRCGRCGYENPEGLQVTNAEPRGRRGYVAYYNDLYHQIKTGDSHMKLICNNCKADV